MAVSPPVPTIPYLRVVCIFEGFGSERVVYLLACFVVLPPLGVEGVGRGEARRGVARLPDEILCLVSICLPRSKFPVLVTFRGSSMLGFHETRHQACAEIYPISSIYQLKPRL